LAFENEEFARIAKVEYNKTQICNMLKNNLLNRLLEI